MLLPSIVLCLVLATHAQRYADRNILPAAEVPPISENNGIEDYNYEEEYGFGDETNVYKWNVEKYPHPRNSPKFCHRLKPSSVCDPDIVLTSAQADMLDGFIQKLYKETPCICESCGSEEGGIVVGIALLKHMFQPYTKHPVKIIRSFAEELRSRWKLGKCDNDIIIVIATTDRLFYTDVGTVASNYIPIHEAHRIFLENKWLFSQGQFYEGLKNILSEYHNSTRGMQQAALKSGVNMSTVAGIVIGTIVLIGVILFVVFLLYKKFYKKGKNSDTDVESGKKKTGFKSVLTKKDIKVFNLDNSGDYEKCRTEEVDQPTEENNKSEQYQKCATDEDIQPIPEEDEMMDFSLITAADRSLANNTQLITVTADSVALEKDLEEAAEGIVKTFPSRKNTVIITDM